MLSIQLLLLGGHMLVHLNGEFNSRRQAELHSTFDRITGAVTIDVSDAWLGASALGEVVCLARRVGYQNVTLANPGPVMRRLLTVSGIDRLVRVLDPGHTA
jgi:anti-anti-sigma regulatory factor